MNVLILVLIGCLLRLKASAWDSAVNPPVASTNAATYRVVISTDFPPLDVIPVKAVKKGDPPERCSDPDDVQSMVRFLLYANEFEVEGLIASAGTFANVARRQNLIEMLELYDRVDENLRRRDARYPTAQELRLRTWQGRDGTWGAPAVGTAARPMEELLGEGRDSEASEAILRIVDRPDPRPVWVCVWGGSSEVAQALWKVRATRKPAEVEQFVGKLRLYLIAKQDATTDWLLETFPKLFIILSEKNYMGMFWVSSGENREVVDLAWVNAHVREGHGPLGAAYPKSGWDPNVPGVWEGDTPSFLHLVSAVRGLNDPERPEQPGWGGQFVRADPAKNHWVDDPAGGKTVSRWRRDFQADFGRRSDWMLP